MRSARISVLRHRPVLEQASRTSDGGGGVTESWTAVATLWAQIRPLSGKERLEADRISGQIGHEVILRYRQGVLPAMRLRHGTRIFHILAVLDEDERHERLKCLCEERGL